MFYFFKLRNLVINTQLIVFSFFRKKDFTDFIKIMFMSFSLF